MASDDKKTKSSPAPKKDVAVKPETVPKKAAESAPKDKAAPDAAKTEAAKTEAPKTEAPEKAADPAAGYSRGEGQKPVSQAYKDNWNAIYGNKSKKKATKKKKR
jgi:hypothetical protein